MSKSFLKSKFAAIILTVILVLSLSFWGQELYKKYQIQQEIEALEQEIESIGQQNDELLSLVNYFQTPEYRERQARSLLNLQKPGEFVVVLPNLDEQFTPQEAGSGFDEPFTNLRSWWEYFFGEGA